MNQTVDFQHSIMKPAYKKGLVLSSNICIGHQIASLLESSGTRMNVCHNASRFYEQLEQEQWDILIADIHSITLGGLAALMYCQKRFPATATYAIVQKNDLYRKMYARDRAGCRGFFYLINGQLKIDTHEGMASVLLGNPNRVNEIIYPRAAIFS